MQTERQKLLSVENLKVWFPLRRGFFRKTIGYIRAVDGIYFNITGGQTLGLVGESGCGKTTVARSVINLVGATEGRVLFDGRDIARAGKKELRKIRREISIIFQDPYSSLNPRMTVGSIIGEPLKVHNIASGSELIDRVGMLLKKVGLSPGHINRYPHEFSGGQRQRIGIARALCLGPKLIICDEPVSALDVSIQSQILNLLKDLQDEFGLTFLFIAHDLAVVEFVSDFVAVMYLGKIVETADAAEIYKNPLHPYTKVLLAAIPTPVPGRRDKSVFKAGEMPSPSNPPPGCPFHPRCPVADALCKTQIPSLEPQKNSQGHLVACWKSLNGAD